MHILYQTGKNNKIKPKLFKSLPTNKLRHSAISSVFLCCSIMPHCHFQSWHFATPHLRHFAPSSQVDITKQLTAIPPVALCPTYTVALCPAVALCPSAFFPLIFFGQIFDFLAHLFCFWHAINPYHQRGYKVPINLFFLTIFGFLARFYFLACCKSLVSKGLRRAGRGLVAVSPYAV